MLQVWLLGQFEIRVEGRRAVIPSRAAQSLLAFLLMTAGTQHRREKLAGMLWPEMSEENARHNFRHELWRVRKSITPPSPTSPEYILAEDFTIGFNPNANYWLDVLQLQRPADDLQSLVSNLSLYHGELLPGFYDDWVGLERERIAGVFEQKMQPLLEQLISDRQWQHVLEWADRWIALGQTPEPAYRGLMRAYAALGEPAKAALAYEHCAEALRNDLGVEPSPETRALFDELVRGDKTAQPMLTPMSPVIIQPSGTVTFLFSDIEGSTKLLEELGDQYATLLGEHRDLLHSVAEKYNGHEVDTQGDAFFFAFFRAADAVAFAAEAQRALMAHAWPHGESLRVRMGLHTGEPLLARTGYVGMDVHRAARIGAAGHGGQVLLSQTTRALVETELPAGTHIDDLGDFQLKDLRYPVHIVQLTIEGLPSDFPPLKSLLTGNEPPAPGEPPFKGLRFFDEADASLFFGREPIVAQLVADLRENRFLAVVVGASGSGKSSVVRAGLIPALRKSEPLADGTLPPEGSQNWRVYMVTPTAHPLEALATILTHDSESVTATATLLDDLATDPRSLSLYLGRKTLPTPLSTGSPQHFFLVVDQFEELFTLCHSEFEREAFLDNLLDAVTLAQTHDNGVGRSHRVTLVLTIRADFYAHLAQYPELRDAVASHQKYIGPMTVEELRRAIELPAQNGGWEFEPGLVDLMLRDVGDEPGALPLLSHALLETWQRRSGHTMTLKGYHDAGGVRGAIAQTAETTYLQLSPEQQIIARNIFLRLTELGEGTEDTRRRARIRELESGDWEREQVRQVLTQLADARLITTSENGAEVAHEALIREWPRLRDWLNENREGLKQHRHLTETAHEWELMERDPGVLYRGIRLAQGVQFAESSPAALNAQEHAFLDASVENAEKEEREKEEARQRELLAKEQLLEAEQVRVAQEQAANQRLRQRALILAGVLVLALLAATAAVFFGNRASENALAAQENAQQEKLARAEAVKQERIATARELAASAIANLDRDAERSVLLALQAIETTRKVDATVLPEAEDALHRAVLASRVRMTLRGHEGAVTSVAFSPDGTRVATADEKETRIWDAASGALLQTVPGVFMRNSWHDANRFATLSADKEKITLQIWDVNTGEQSSATSFTKSADDFASAAINPDLTRLIIGYSDGKLEVRDVARGIKLLDLVGHTGSILNESFSQDGKLIASSSGDQDKTVKVWDASNGKEIVTLPIGSDVDVVRFTPDGKRVVSGANDNVARVWEIPSGRELYDLYGHTNFVTDIAFSPDGSRIATASWDRSAKVWDAATGRQLFTLSGHENFLEGIAFSPDGQRLITGSDDKTAKVWDASPSSEVFSIDAGGRVSRGAVNPGGTRLVTGGHAVQVWDISQAFVSHAPNAKQLMTLRNEPGNVDPGFSPNGKLIVSGTFSGQGFAWDAETGQQAFTLPLGTDGMGIIVAFSPDGTRFAMSTWESLTCCVRIWDAKDGKLLLKLDFSTVGVGIEGIAFTPDGKELVAGKDDGTVTIWDVTTGRLLSSFQAHTNWIWDVRFSPDGKRMITSSRDSTAKVWDTTTWKQLFTLQHTSTVERSEFSRDGTLIATGSNDGTAKIWDAATGKELLTLYGATSGVSSALFSPDGTRVITTSVDGAIRVSLVRLEDLVDLAKSRLTRTWREDECQKYLHVETCPAEK